MTLEDFSTHFAKFWSQGSDNQWHLADNAPVSFWKYVMRDGRDRQLIYQGLKAIAANKAPEAPNTQYIMRWFANNPDKMDHFKAVLKDYKTPPRSIDEIMEKAYKKELFSVVSSLHQFLTAELNRF